jgi:hypothetical protein
MSELSKLAAQLPPETAKKFTRVQTPDTGRSHVLSADLACQLLRDAWRDTHYLAMRSVPHDDAHGDGFRDGQRDHVLLMLATFCFRVEQHVVAAGLFASPAEYHAYGEAYASDPAPAGVACEGGAA